MEKSIPRVDNAENTIVGVGNLSSAMIGAPTVASLATRLHIPKAVEVKITGNTIGVVK